MWNTLVTIYITVNKIYLVDIFSFSLFGDLFGLLTSTWLFRVSFSSSSDPTCPLRESIFALAQHFSSFKAAISSHIDFLSVSRFFTFISEDAFASVRETIVVSSEIFCSSSCDCNDDRSSVSVLMVSSFACFASSTDNIFVCSEARSAVRVMTFVSRDLFFSSDVAKLDCKLTRSYESWYNGKQALERRTRKERI